MEIYADRVARAQTLMAEAEADLVTLSLGSNMRYLSGFTDEPGERLLLLLVPQKGSPVFVVPELYADQVRQISRSEQVRVWKDGDDPRKFLKRTIADLGKRSAHVLVDDTMWAMFFLMLKEALPRADFGLASQVMIPLRLRKTPDEIEHMVQAGAVADEAFEEVLQMKVSGMSELELATVLEETMKEKGAEKVAFETLVASGPNSALPHHRAGKRIIESGDVAILDFGCRCGGYCSDMSRTISCGEPSPEIRTVYEIVARAQEKAVRAVEPGVEAQTIDRKAREEISRAGYGDQFIHRTGHGIGLDVHEAPYIVEGNGLVLQEGMAFSIEPGVYLPGRFGIRIEDVVVVNRQGAKSMTSSPHALQVIQ
jgi:Xaa-Pro aminopeptidase